MLSIDLSGFAADINIWMLSTAGNRGLHYVFVFTTHIATLPDARYEHDGNSLRDVQ